jgi:tripartite-type tricarboxylate transporter receptor subunit TctC
VLLALCATAQADAPPYPTKPVRMVVPFPPGGATDIIARLLSQKLHELWGQPVIPDYKPGAGTVLGTDIVAKSAPDGHTLGMVITAHVINPSLRPDMPFDTLKDLSGVSLVSTSDIVIVATPSLPAGSMAELIALARQNPGQLSYASPGTGTAMHLIGELIKSLSGIDIVHVPYKGGGAAYPDVMTGRVQLQIDPLFASMQNIRTGKVKAIAVTSRHRATMAPEIPTVAETLPGVEVESIAGVVVPSATPRDLVQRISADIARALRSPDLQERMKAVGLTPVGGTPEAFDAYIRTELARWSEVVKSSGATLD